MSLRCATYVALLRTRTSIAGISGAMYSCCRSQSYAYCCIRDIALYELRFTQFAHYLFCFFSSVQPVKPPPIAPAVLIVTPPISPPNPLLFPLPLQLCLLRVPLLA